MIPGYHLSDKQQINISEFDIKQHNFKTVLIEDIFYIGH